MYVCDVYNKMTDVLAVILTGGKEWLTCVCVQLMLIT